MNAKVSVFVTCFEGIIYLLLYNLHGCTFKQLLTTIEYDQLQNISLKRKQKSIYLPIASI